MDRRGRYEFFAEQYETYLARVLNYVRLRVSDEALAQDLAAETFERALESELTEERAKEIRYNHGDVLERMNELAKAQDQFSDVAQMDYNYKDVRHRLEGVRKKIAAGDGEQEH